MTGESITALGYPQYGLGQYGLGQYGLSDFGPYNSAYSSYMPTAMSMGMYDPYSMGTMNCAYNPYMMNMYNPQFMAKMQQDIEVSNLQHAGAMHNIMKDVEVSNYSRSDEALIEQIAQNGSVASGISNLYQKVREGDQEGVMQEWDKVKEYVKSTYQDKLSARADKVNIDETVTEIVKRLYSSTVSAQEGRTADLVSDIKKYGETHFQNGFNEAFFGDGHSKATIGDTLEHCFGLRIDDEGSKKTQRKIGASLGEGLEWGAWTLGGTAAAAGVTALGMSAVKACTKAPKQGVTTGFKYAVKNASTLKTIGKIGKYGGIATGIAVVAGAIWQLCKD